MSSISTDLSQGFQKIMDRNGKSICVKYYSISFPGVYDDDIKLTQSGATLWTSGIVLPAQKRDQFNSSDPILMEQGKYTPYDQILYVNGSLALATGSLDVKIGLGSPSQGFYSIIPLGTITPEDSDVKIYKKIFLRKLTNGSLIGES